MNTIADTLITLDRRMDAILAENPNGMTAQAQAEYSSLQRSHKMIQQVGQASLTGVNLATTAWGTNLQTGEPQLTSRRQADTQLEYEQAKQARGDGASLQRGSVMTINLNGRGKSAEELFGRPTPKSGFRSLAEQMWHISQGTQMAVAGASSGNSADGGYLVAQEFADTMLNGSREKEIVRPFAHTVGMKSDNLTVTDFDDHTHANGEHFGGLKFQWESEGGEMDYQFPKMRQMKLATKKATMLVPATNELLADARNYGNMLQDAMKSALGAGLDYTFLVGGLGGGQPVSCMKADSTITVSKDSGQAADTISWSNLCNMFARLHPGCIGNSRWVFSNTCIPQLLQLSIPVGTGGEVVPVMTGSNGDYRILTRPVHFTEKMNPIGDLGDCMLVDFTQYLIGIRDDGMRLDISRDALFTSDQTLFRLIMRVDGRPKWAEAFQPMNSAPTLSWCVTLQAR